MPRGQPRYRIMIDVDEDLYFRAINLFPWGTRNAVLKEVVEQTVTAVESAGLQMAYAMAAGKIKLFGKE